MQKTKTAKRGQVAETFRRNLYHLLDKQTDIIHDNNQKARVLYTKKYPDEFPNRNIKIKCHIAQLITLDNTNCIENN